MKKFIVTTNSYGEVDVQASVYAIDEMGRLILSNDGATVALFNANHWSFVRVKDQA